ncbi:hypothetical protein HK104_000962 [Borealophlyctis nickersoniae]|nr:hypothetical protein HK104_000962 [Borealophlyctis nickersoniae]
MSLPYELFRPIARCCHPSVGRNLRSLNKALSKIITLHDLLWGEAGWRWHQSAAKCWVWAARHGHGWIVGALQQAHPEEMVSFGWAASVVAAASGHADLVRTLVAAVGDYEVPKNVRISVEAKSSNIPEIVSHLVDSLVVIMGDQEDLLQIEELDFSEHLNLNVKDYSIWLAAFRNHREVVQVLIQAGANVDVDEGLPLSGTRKGSGLRNGNRKGIHGYSSTLDFCWPVNDYAEEHLEDCYPSADYGHIIHTLLVLGMNIHVNDDAPIRLAAEYGDTETVQLLVERGANVQAQDNGALSAAVKGRHVEVIRLLLKAGADVHAVGAATLDLIKAGGRSGVFGLLVKAGLAIE